MTKPVAITQLPTRPNALPARVSRRRRKRDTLVTVTLYDPRKLAALRTAVSLGVRLAVEFDGFRLNIRTEDP